MESIIASLVRRHVENLVKEHCTGCQRGSLSQREHECLTGDYKLQILMNLEEALSKIQIEEVFQKLKDENLFDIFQSRIFRIICENNWFIGINFIEVEYLQYLNATCY